MRQWFKDLDGLLRGDSTRVTALKGGTIGTPAKGLIVAAVMLGLVYGVFMGFYPLFREGGPVWQQFLATTVKVPLLFVLTLVVTFPSLYVFNALAGSRLTMVSVLRLLVAALAVNLTVLASLGPIAAFFAVSTTSYSFMVLLNVVAFGVAGAFGLLFLLRTLHRLVVATADGSADGARVSLRASGKTWSISSTEDPCTGWHCRWIVSCVAAPPIVSRRQREPCACGP